MPIGAESAGKGPGEGAEVMWPSLFPCAWAVGEDSWIPEWSVGLEPSDGEKHQSLEDARGLVSVGSP